MYIDDGSDLDGQGLDGELTVDAGGQEYVAAETVDYDHDGVLDATDVATGDGGRLLYVDMDDDGTADEAITYDAQGHATAAAHYDPATGQWVADQPPSADPVDTVAGGDMRVDTAQGTVDAGPPTVDSDGDGTDDTAIVHAPDGSTILYTDMDGDGSADVATVIGADGSTETLRHTGEHEWTPVDGDRQDSGSSGKRADPTGDGFWGAAGAASGARANVLRIDSETGQWVSPN